MNFVELVHNPSSQKFVSGFLTLLEKYFRVEVQGIENIPPKGAAVLIPNHSGFSGADAVMLAHMIHKRSGRAARIIAHRGYFEWFDFVKRVSESFGLKEASMASAVEILKNGKILIVFPEGESGNFKSSLRRYYLRRFHSGFVRMALKAGVPVIPVTIVGAEETHLNVGVLDLGRFVKGLKIPLPVNLIPFPAKWHIRFGQPLDLSTYSIADTDNPEKMRELAENIRLRLQAELDAEVRKRPYVYFPVSF